MRKTLSITFFLFILSIITVMASSNVVEQSFIVTGGTDGKVHSSVTLKNIGDAVAPPFVYEIEPKKQTFAVISQQSVCDPSYPQNVHKVVTALGPGEIVLVSLDAPVGTNGKYDVYGVSYDSCCPQNSQCKAVQPYLPTGGKFLQTVTVSGVSTAAVCGDGVCSGSETIATCSKDCHGYCGDTYCDPKTENQYNCAPDCYSSSSTLSCGNGICEPDKGETSSYCSQDCKIPPPTSDTNSGTSANSEGKAILHLGGFIVPAIIVIVALLILFFIWRKHK